jgi:hypothetical protein
MVVTMMFFMAMKQIKKVSDFSMQQACEKDMIAAEVSKLDKGIAVDLYRFTGGRSAEEMKDLPQCKGVQR